MECSQSLRWFLHRADADIYYEVTGSGPGLVFAHGLAGNHLSWWQQVPYFSDRYTCVTFSNRGFALSNAASGGLESAPFTDDLAALIDHMQFPKVSLVAQSMGGWSCLEYALREPSRVHALVMAGTTGTVDLNSICHREMDHWKTWTEQMSLAHVNLIAQGIHIGAGARMAREQPALHFLYREIQDLNISLDKATLREKLQQMRTLSATALAQLPIPVLFIVGEEDVVSFPGASAALASLIPNAKLERVPQAGHSVYFERSQIFNQLIESFLSSALA